MDTTKRFIMSSGNKSWNHEANQGTQNRAVVFVSKGCHNKLQKLAHLRQWKYILAQSWRPEAPKSKCHWSSFLLEALRESAFHASPLAPGGRWQSLAFLICRCSNPISTSVFISLPPCVSVSQTSLCLSFIVTFVTEFRTLPKSRMIPSQEP